MRSKVYFATRAVLIASIFFLPFISHAAVSSFVFTAAPSVLSVNDASCKFTVTANENIPETFDIFLTSTGSGEFSSSSTNWIAATKVTMSTGTANRSFYYKGTSSGSVTITATAKPRTGTGEFPVSAQVTIGGSSNCDGGASSTDDEDDESDTADDEHAVTEKEVEVALVDPDPVYTAIVHFPATVVRGIPARFESVVEKAVGPEVFTTLKGRYEWSMGDGTEYKFEENTKIDHIYAYPGEYTAVFRYYSNFFKEKPDSIHRKTIIVLPDAVVIARTTSDGGIVVKNNSGKEIDFGGWILENDGRTYEVPKYTYIGAGKELAIAPNIHQIATVGKINLENGQGTKVFAYGQDLELPSNAPGVMQMAAVPARKLQPVLQRVSPFASTQSASVLGRSLVAEADSSPLLAKEGVGGGEREASDSHQLFEPEGSQSLRPGLSATPPQTGGEELQNTSGSNIPLVLFIVLVLGAVVGYSVYLYGRRRNFGTNARTGDGSLADEFAIEDIIKGE